MILAPRNVNVAQLNESILNRMAGGSCQYVSADSIIEEAGANPMNAEPIPVEVLRSINSSSLPPGELNLKIGCPVILLRNLDIYLTKFESTTGLEIRKFEGRGDFDHQPPGVGEYADGCMEVSIIQGDM